MVTLNPEAAPKIVDFAVWDENSDLTTQVLEGTKFLVLTQKVEGADTESLQKIKKLLVSLGNRVEPLAVTSISPEDYRNFQQTQNFKLPYAYADATVIKTMIRSNPGIILLSDGVVLGKWHYNDVPSKEDILELLP
jgi:hypothetical protein